MSRNSDVDDMVARAKRERKRCADEISHCDSLISDIEDQKRKHQRTDRFWQNIESLRTRGEASWKSLDQGNKWKKSIVLACFESGKIPREMTEASWTKSAPAEIRSDRDVLLARLSRKEFSETYYKESGNVFQIPEQLINDKVVVAKAASSYPEVLLLQEDLPAKHFDDDDVFLAYVRSKRMETAMDESWVRDVGDARRNAATRVRNIVGKFSERIRGNATLMLQAAAHEANVFDHVASTLRDDSVFAAQLVNRAPQVPGDALEKFSKRIRGNRHVVLAFVQKNGICLKGASPSLLGDNKVVRAACTTAAEALAYCAPGRTRYTLGRDKNFLLDIFSRLEVGDRKLWEMVSPSLKLDPDLVVAALKKDCASVEDLPLECMRDVNFCTELVKRNPSLWYSLPNEFQDDPKIVRSITNFGSESLVGHVIERLPFLASDRALWATIIDSDLCDAGEESVYDDDGYWPLRNVIRSHAAESIRNDKALMMLACKNETAVLECLASQLQQDRDVVQTAVEENGLALLSIPDLSQRAFPDLVAKAISNLTEEVLLNEPLEFYEDHVAEELWSNLEVAEAWLKAGGRIHNRFPDALKNNHDFGLLVAEHCDLDDFDRGVSAQLLSDKGFMMAAVEWNSSAYLRAPDILRRDYDLALAAFASPNASELNDYYRNAFGRHRDEQFLLELREKVQKKMKVHELFTKGFLYGMSERAGPNCHVRMLVQDVETTLSFKRSIAEFLGVPTGMEVGPLRRALKNIPTWKDLGCGCPGCGRRG